MAYPFDNSEDAFRNSIKPLSRLAETETPFDPDFGNRLPSGKAYGFDEIKDRVCAYRSSNARSPLRSSDAFLVENGVNGEVVHYYFIEFKNQRADNIQSLRDPGSNELMQKAFDSLTVAAMTFGRGLAMRDIQERSTFIVVYPKQNYSDRFLDALNRCADSQPLWHLDKLSDNGFFHEVRTIDDEEFTQLRLPYIR